MRRTLPLLALTAGLTSAADPKLPDRWRPADPPPPGPYVAGFRPSADGRRLVVSTWGTDGGVVRALDLTAGTSVTLTADRDKGVDAVPSPDGRWAVGVRGAEPDWQVVVWDAAAGKEVYAEPVTKREAAQYWRLRALGFDQDGGAWVVRPAGVIDRVEVPSGRVTRSIQVPFTAGAVGRLILSPDGRWLALGGGTVFAVRRTDPAADWRVVERHPEPTDQYDGPQPTTCPIPCGFSPDGRRLVTYDRKGEVVAVWEVGDKVAKLASRPAGLTPWTHLDDLTFTPDGERFAFVAATRPPSQDRAATELRVWDAATLKEVGRVAPSGGVAAFAVTPAGRLLLAHPDGALSMQDMPGGK
ncbi:MAG: WD40 repeat domain-containing protein [Gemmataceae bacterium]|nr:WD40 repeat domain-containing protein [Gemmataceae bacterium]